MMGKKGGKGGFKKYEKRKDSEKKNETELVGNKIKYERNKGGKEMELRMPSFLGSCDHKVYLEWEWKVEQILACHNYS